MKNVKRAVFKQKWELIGSLLLLAVFTLPFLTFADSRKDMYVDESAHGMEDGSAGNPYHTIEKAMDHANDRTDVHVEAGTYKENIKIPNGVRLYGNDKHEVIIRGDNQNEPVVKMGDNTEINKITVEEGEQGILVKEDANDVSIIKCIVRHNDSDGIHIEGGSTDKDEAVSITETKIEKNGRAGIFSHKRRLVLMYNQILDNDSDGADIASGSSAWIEHNDFNGNGGSGMKLKLDESNIWTKSNNYRGNDHDGIEVNAFGKEGRIDINKSKFFNNKNYGISRIARESAVASNWNGLTVQPSTTFESTNQGTISRIIRIN